MITDLNYFLLIMGMCLVTYLPRMIPVTFLSKREIPEIFVRFLSHIPAAVLAALFFPAVLLTDGKMNISTSNPMLLCSLIALPIAYKTKNMFLTVIIGMAAFVLLMH
ncbi:MAG: AzlD domain-containing protein [Tepidanaerobacteraceae bacterium]|jgi:branched-subunit amino acid transport protein